MIALQSHKKIKNGILAEMQRLREKNII